MYPPTIGDASNRGLWSAGFMRKSPREVLDTCLISRISASNLTPNTLKYVSSKSALVGRTRSLAVDCAADNIQVNMVCPGFVETDPVSHVPKSFINKVGMEMLMRRDSTALDVAQVEHNLASNQSSVMTSQKIMVTGGQVPFH
jgi:NAD(P)-dependent dehydrogenase (short-subunit alcohol dehydrogenase family)